MAIYYPWECTDKQTIVWRNNLDCSVVQPIVNNFHDFVCPFVPAIDRVFSGCDQVITLKTQISDCLVCLEFAYELVVKGKDWNQLIGKNAQHIPSSPKIAIVFVLREKGRGVELHTLVEVENGVILPKSTNIDFVVCGHAFSQGKIFEVMAARFQLIHSIEPMHSQNFIQTNSVHSILGPADIGHHWSMLVFRFANVLESSLLRWNKFKFLFKHIVPFILAAAFSFYRPTCELLLLLGKIELLSPFTILRLRDNGVSLDKLLSDVPLW